MLRSVSATNLVKKRPGFGHRVIPRAGSVLASPVPASYDPDPDYFFHWFRDSAIIIDALRVAEAEGLVDATSIERLREFVEFSRALRKLDGYELLRQGHFRKRVQPSFLQYVRSDDEIAAVFGEAVLAEARVNPDGTLDFTRWARPQNDGPALEVLALTRWRDTEPDLDEGLQASMLELVICDLDFIRSRTSERSFDIWEEESGYHYYTQLAQAEALARGAEWLENAGHAAPGPRLPFRGGRTPIEPGLPFGARKKATTAQGLASPAASRKSSRHFGDSWRSSCRAQGGNAQRPRPKSASDTDGARRPFRRGIPHQP